MYARMVGWDFVSEAAAEDALNGDALGLEELVADMPRVRRDVAGGVDRDPAEQDEVYQHNDSIDHNNKYHPDLDGACPPVVRNFEEIRTVSRRNGHHTRVLTKTRYMKIVLVEVKARFGLLEDTPVNRRIIREHIYVFCRRNNVRHTDIAKFIDLAVVFAFVPSVDEIEAKIVEGSLIVEEHKVAYHSVCRPPPPRQ